MKDWLNIYSSGISALYLVVDCALLIAAIFAARHPKFRREFCCFVIASALSAFCAADALILRFYLTFHPPVLTLEIRRVLLIADEVAEVASIVVYCVGFFALARQVASLPRESNGDFR